MYVCKLFSKRKVTVKQISIHICYFVTVKQISIYCFRFFCVFVKLRLPPLRFVDP